MLIETFCRIIRNIFDNSSENCSKVVTKVHHSNPTGLCTLGLLYSWIFSKYTYGHIISFVIFRLISIMLLRFSFAFISISLIASTATVADAAKTVRGTRRGLKSTKAPKSPKSGKIGKSGKSGKSSSSPSSSPSESPSGSPSGSPSFGGYYQTRMLESEMGERKLSLQYMTDRFNEEGSVRSFVDSLGYEANLQSGRGEKENVLSKKDCEGLMSLINIDSDEDKYPFEDYQKYIDENDLVSIIGKVRTLPTNYDH